MAFDNMEDLLIKTTGMSGRKCRDMANKISSYVEIKPEFKSVPERKVKTIKEVTEPRGLYMKEALDEKEEG